MNHPYIYCVFLKQASNQLQSYQKLIMTVKVGYMSHNMLPFVN